MTASAVPVALHWLRIKADDNVVIFGNSVKEPPGDIHLIANCGWSDRSNLEFPLSWHDFRVRARNGESGINARLGVLFDNFTSDDTTSSNAAVVRALRGGLSATGREAEG